MGLFSFLFGGETPKDKIEYHKRCIEKLKNDLENYKSNMARCRDSFAARTNKSKSDRAAHKNTMDGYKRNIESCKKGIAGHKERIADLRKQK